MANVVAVDGGASRCRLAVFSEDGEELLRLQLEQHASLSMGVDSAWKHIAHGMQLVLDQLRAAGHRQPEHLAMGLAGSLRQQHRQEFLQLVPASYKRTLVTDGHAQLIGATAGKPGICLAVGTGSVLHWLDEEGNSGMFGGWGFPIGDEGSGAWLGMRAMQCYIHAKERQLHHSSLIAALALRVGTDVSAIQQWSTETRANVLAQLAPLVFEHAALSDGLALGLIHEAVEQCLGLINLAPAHLPVFVVGGIGEQLEARVAQMLDNRVHDAHSDALHGLWLLSKTSS